MSISPQSEIVLMAKEIQAIPSPTFSESKRAEFLSGIFTTLSLSDVHIDPIGNVNALIKGGDAPPLVISAHLDSVMLPDENSPLIEGERQITGPGIGDNALGLAALVEIGRNLISNNAQPAGDIWLIGNVGEEGLGNLKGMQHIVNRFKDDVTAYLVLEGIGLGMIQNSALGIHRFKIEVNTMGGHAWSNFGDPSAIHEMVALSAR
ncbi:M20/M25/M40 family metallo-hydrolase, partial [bacterium]|nr:M20/M25/M40 family metallo-hydrolase [bacterium]